MIVKQKKNAKLIYEPKNGKYYLDKITNLEEYRNEKDAFEKYHEFHKHHKEDELRFFEDGMLKYEFSPEQVFLLAKGVQMLKYFVDNSFFFDCKETLKDKSIDLFYLYQIIYKQYNAYVPKDELQKLESKNRNFKLIKF